MTLTAKKIDERLRLKGELKKQKHMVYLPNDLSAAFKKVCAQKGFSLTEVMEELVREYVDSAETEKKEKK